MFEFHNGGRLDASDADQTQKTQQSARFANYMLTNYRREDILSSEYIDFESRQLTMLTGNPVGPGIGGDVVDKHSDLAMNFVIERPFEKLDLRPRTFLTVPYLGRGSCDPTVENKLRFGEYFFDKKSVNTIMEQNFAERGMRQPLDGSAQENQLEEAALDGWARGGARTRDLPPPDA